MCFYPACGFKYHPCADVLQVYFSNPVFPLTLRPLWQCPPPISTSDLGLYLSHLRAILHPKWNFILFFLSYISVNPTTTVYSTPKVKLLGITLDSSLPFAPLHLKLIQKLSMPPTKYVLNDLLRITPIVHIPGPPTSAILSDHNSSKRRAQLPPVPGTLSPDSSQGHLPLQFAL